MSGSSAGSPAPHLPAPGPWRGLAARSVQASDRVARAVAELDALGWPGEHPLFLDLLIYLAMERRPEVEATLASLPPAQAGRLGARLIGHTCAARAFRLDAARVGLQQVLDEARAAGDAHLLAWALASAALASALSGQRLEAYQRIGESIELGRAIGHRTIEALGLCNLGYLYAQDNRPEPYARFTREALALFRALGDQHGVIFCLGNLGGALLELGEHIEAEACLREGLAGARARGWRKVEAICLAGRGGLGFRYGQPERAIADYLDSEVILIELGEHHGAVRQRLLMSERLLREGWLPEAELHAVQALKMAEGRGFSGLQRGALRQLGEALAAAGRHSEAYAALKRAEAMGEAELEARVEEARQSGARLEGERQARLRAEAERARAEALEAQNAALTSALAEQKTLSLALERTSRTDTLTGLENRGGFDAALRSALGLALRQAQPLSLLVIDIDHFKQINDQHGHAVGDEVLVELGRRLLRRARASDRVARWGGDELCVLLPGTALAGAMRVAELLLQAIRDAPFATAAGPLRLTASVGVAEVAPGEAEPLALLGRADEALYRAKRGGRDRAEPAAPPELDGDDDTTADDGPPAPR